MLYELTIAIVSVAFSFLVYFSFHNFFHNIFYRNNEIKLDERHDLNGKELIFVSVVRIVNLIWIEEINIVSNFIWKKFWLCTYNFATYFFWNFFWPKLSVLIVLDLLENTNQPNRIVGRLYAIVNRLFTIVNDYSQSERSERSSF